MSAYVVSQAHIHAIVNFAYIKFRRDPVLYPPSGFRPSVDCTQATELGQILLDQNVRSVDYRYNEKHEPETFTHRLSTTVVSLEQFFSCIACLEYQSCESNDWPETQAFHILQGLKDKAIRLLPGYDKTKWSLDDGDLPTTQVVDLSRL